MRNEMVNSLNKALGKINGSYQKWYQENNQNSYFIDTLNALYHEPDLSQKEISSNYMIPPQTVNNAIKVLEKKKYIELLPCKNDKRRKKIKFSTEGEKYLKAMIEPLNTLDNKIAEDMGRERYQLLIELLEQYGDILDKNIKDKQD